MISPYKRIAVFDIETGGLNKAKHAITEIAVVMVDFPTLEIIGTWSSLIKPYRGVYYTQEAADVSGISRDLLEEEGLPIEEVANNFLDFIDEYRDGSKPILAGHNIDKFDIPFIEAQLLSKIGRKVGQTFNKEVTFDTMKMARAVWVESTDYRLPTCCANFNHLIEQAHRALPDTEANAKLLIDILNRMRGLGVTDNKRERLRVNYEF